MKVELLKPGVPRGRPLGSSVLATAYSKAVDLKKTEGVTIDLAETGLSSPASIHQIVSRYNRLFGGNIGVRKIAEGEYQLYKRG